MIRGLVNLNMCAVGFVVHGALLGFVVHGGHVCRLWRILEMEPGSDFSAAEHVIFSQHLIFYISYILQS